VSDLSRHSEQGVTKRIITCKPVHFQQITQHVISKHSFVTPLIATCCCTGAWWRRPT
jgi:hypothetical protein